MLLFLCLLPVFLQVNVIQGTVASLLGRKSGRICRGNSCKDLSTFWRILIDQSIACGLIFTLGLDQKKPRFCRLYRSPCAGNKAGNPKNCGAEERSMSSIYIENVSEVPLKAYLRSPSQRSECHESSRKLKPIGSFYPWCISDRVQPPLNPVYL